MASSISFDIIAKDRASSTFSKIGESTGRTTSRLKSFGKAAALALGGVGVAAATAGVKFTKMAIDDEASTKKLARALQNNAHATKQQIGATEDWITAQGKAYGVADDDLRPALVRLVGATHSVGKAQKLASLAMNVSAGTGKDLGTVSLSLAKAQAGNVGALGRLGIATKDANGKTMSLKQITEKLATTYKGQAATAANTAAGRFARVKLAVSETAEAIGYHLLPIASGIANWLLSKGIPAFEQFAGKVSGVADKISTAFSSIHLGGLASKVKAAVGKVDIGDLGTKLAEQAKSWAAPIIAGFKAGLDTGDWSGLGKALGNGLVKALSGLGSLAGKVTKKLGSILGKIDWVGIGIDIGKQAPSLLIGLAVGLLNFDLLGLLKGLAAHWQDALLAVLAVAFTPGKIIGKVGELLARIPLVGKLLQWALLHFKSFSDGLVGMVGKALGFMGRAFLTGFRRVFPGVGAAFGAGLRLLPTRLGVIALDIQAKALGMMRKLAGAIARGTGAVVAKIGEVIALILKPWVDAHVWLLKRGIELLRGLGSGIRTGAVAVFRFLGGIGGRIVGAVGDLGSLLVNAGKAVIQGLINGIGAMIGALKSKLKSVTDLIPKHKGPIEKDRKILDPAGRAIMDGLIGGIERKKGALKKALSKITDMVQAAGDKLSGLQDTKAGFLSTFQADSVFGADVSGKKGIGALLDFQQQQATRAAQLMADVQTVAGMGLSKSLIAQLQAAGASGAQQLHLLAGGSASQIQTLNALNAQTESSLQAAGMYAGNYGRGGNIDAEIDAAARREELLKQILATLQKKEHKIEIHDKSGNPKKTAREVSRRQRWAGAR